MSSDPNFIFGEVPTAAQWNNAFDTKQDTLGFAPVNKAGDSMLGKLVTTASIAGSVGFAITPGVTPNTPSNGDIWLTNAGMFAQINGSGVQLAAGSGVVNSGTAQQLAYYAVSGAAISGNPRATIFNGALTLGVQGSGVTGTILLAGLASGGITLAGAAAGGSGTITFPAGTVDFSSTGGASQVVAQGTVGGIFTVRRLSLGDLSNTTTGTGAVVLANSPILISPALGTPSSGSLGSCVGLPLTTGITGVLPVANGGTNDTGTAWTTYTPIVTAGSGVFTTVSATGRWKSLGKTIFIEINVTDTLNGSAGGFIIATLPIVPVLNNSFALSGFNGTTANLCAGNVSTAGGGTVNIFKYDGTFPIATGQNVWVSGVYESA